MTGTTIQGYRIIRKLGEGGMAEVYYAENPLGLPIAIKILRKHLSEEKDIRMRFEQEAHVMAKLSHPFIRRVVNITAYEGRPVILMEYLSGQDLGAHVRQNGALPPDTAARLWEQAVSALQYAHSEGVIHRDVKPSNFFLTDTGSLKLLDFGIAKAGDQLVQTMTGQQMGTVLYMSPEQIKDPKRVTKATDYYSLGVTFYHLLTGKPPYDVTTESSFAIQTKIVQEELDSSKVPAGWRGGLAACLEKEANKRQLYESVGDFPAAEALASKGDQTLIDGSEEKGGKKEVTSGPPAAAPSVQRQPLRWLPLLLVALLTAATVVGVVWWLQRGPSGSTLQPVQDPSGKWGYADESGSYVLPAVYDSAGVFSGGYAQVSRGDSVLRIDESGALAEVLAVLAPVGDTTVATVAEEAPALEEPEEVEESDSKQEEYDAIIASAGRNYDRGNYERALGKYKSALGLVSDDSAANAGISKCEEKLGELSESSAWSEARRRDTESSYESYLIDYPDGPHAREARSRLGELSESSAWSEARRRDTESSYESYLSDYPDGPHAREARSRLEALRKPALPPTIQALERNMVRVSGGSFTMGCTSEQSNCDDDEKPAHRVELSSYRIGKYEVTQAQWEAVMGSNPSKFSGCSSCPVEEVSWNDVQDFIKKLNVMTGGNYRLPTEAEWEYAARGGSRSQGYKYAGSNNVGSVGWYDDNSGSKTHPVGKKSPNELGLYDMSGNVYEWCSDWYGSDYYSSSPGRNPKGPGGGSNRVRRGGGWFSSARGCRASNRFGRSPDGRRDGLGFRLAAAP